MDYIPLLTTALIANMVTILFYLTYKEDLQDANAWELPQLFCILLGMESTVFIGYMTSLLITKRNEKSSSSSSSSPTAAICFPPGKNPDSFVSNICTRTVLIVSGVLSVFALRDLVFPGTIMELLPKDDLYLEWTNAFQHSPPPNSPEYLEYGMSTMLYVGDKFVSQQLALNLLLLTMYKVVACVYIRYGADGRGKAQSQILFWKTSAIANGLLVFVFRTFCHTAGTVSIDFHLPILLLMYETGILALYGYSSSIV